jgi:hypothetical protein
MERDCVEQGQAREYCMLDDRRTDGWTVSPEGREVIFALLYRMNP